MYLYVEVCGGGPRSSSNSINPVGSSGGAHTHHSRTPRLLGGDNGWLGENGIRRERN